MTTEQLLEEILDIIRSLQADLHKERTGRLIARTLQTALDPWEEELRGRPQDANEDE